MANQAAPEIEVVLDRPRKLRFDLNAMIRLEEALGINLLGQADENAEAKVEAEALESLRGIRAMLWACLIHEDPDLTPEYVGTLLHVGNLAQISALMQRIWSLSTPKAGKSRPPG